MKCKKCNKEIREIAKSVEGSKLYFCCDCEIVFVDIKEFAVLNFVLESRRFSVIGVPGDGGVGYDKRI